MFGIKIAKWLREWPSGFQGLDHFLVPIGEQLRPLWWIADASTWNLPPEWWTTAEWDGTQGIAWRAPRAVAFEQSFVAGHDHRHIARPGFLPDFADLISEDWTVLYGMPFDPATCCDVLQHRTTTNEWFCGPDEFHPSVSVVLRSVDAAYWEMFARDSVAIDRVEHHLAAVPGLRVERLA